jgi:trehalose-phosphatase
MKYLLDNLADLRTALGEKHLLLMLDFDGTLAPIALTPGQALLPEGTRRDLERLSKNPDCSIAIVSGRSLADVAAKVSIPGITYVGNHGLEVSWADGAISVFALPGFAGCVLMSLKKDLAVVLARYPGAGLEDKGCSLAVHYRLVARTERPQVRAAIDKVVHAHGGRAQIEMLSGRMVVDLRPPGAVDKGTIVSMLIRSENQRRGEGCTFALYMGDDRSDEGAFKAVAGQGFGVLVGSRGISCAPYSLKGPRDVGRLLTMLGHNSGGREVANEHL